MYVIYANSPGVIDAPICMVQAVNNHWQAALLVKQKANEFLQSLLKENQREDNYAPLDDVNAQYRDAADIRARFDKLAYEYTLGYETIGDPSSILVYQVNATSGYVYGYTVNVKVIRKFQYSECQTESVWGDSSPPDAPKLPVPSPFIPTITIPVKPSNPQQAKIQAHAGVISELTLVLKQRRLLHNCDGI